MILRGLKWLGLGGLGLLLVGVLAGLLWPEKTYAAYETNPVFTAEALAYPFPPLPDDWEDNSVSADDGTKIYWGQTGNYDTAKASVILVPGLKSSMLMKGDEVAFMTARGYHVIGMDLRGQGRSGKHRDSHPEKLYAEDFSVYANDLRRVIEAANLPSDKPVILMGISFGAATATRAAGEFDLPIDALMPIVPAYRPLMPPFSYDAAKRITRVMRALGKAEYYAPGQDNWKPYTPDLTQPTVCASNPQRLYLSDALYVRYPEQRVGGVTVQWLAEIMENGELVSTPEFGAKLDMPTSMVLASDDYFVNNDYASKACNEAFANCTITQIPNTGHCITMEHDNVLNAVYDALDALLARIQT